MLLKKTQSALQSFSKHVDERIQVTRVARGLVNKHQTSKVLLNLLSSQLPLELLHYGKVFFVLVHSQLVELSVEVEFQQQRQRFHSDRVDVEDITGIGRASAWFRRNKDLGLLF